MTDNMALKNFERFFELDMRIKEQLYMVAPANPYNLDVMKYSDKLLKNLNTIEREILELCITFELGADVETEVHNIFEEYRERVNNTDYTYGDLSKIYNECFAQMTEETLSLVKENIFGDGLIYGEPFLEEDLTLAKIIGQCHSVNEILHALHSYITMDVDVLRSIPQIDQKLNIEEEPITVRGDVNPLAYEVYQAFDANFDTGTTDIISVNSSDKILIMVRDRGHAVTIETNMLNENEIGVYYFIAKATVNPEMISKLKGINNFKSGDLYASGSFVTPKEQLASDLFELVKGIPTDFDYDPKTRDSDGLPLKR